MLKKTCLFSFSLFLIFCVSCTNNQYENAKKLFIQKNYVPAIEEFDIFLKKSNDRFETLEAEEMRAEAYYQLGLIAFEKNNYNLAVRLFYLSNTDKADIMIVNSYEILINQYLERNEKQRILACYDYLIQYFYLSEKTEEFSYLRIKSIIEWENNEDKAWEYYCQMVKLFPESEYTKKSELIINQFIEKKINSIVVNKNTYSSLFLIIEELKFIKSFPNTYHPRLDQEIANLYLELADNQLNENQLNQALQYYQEAINHYKQMEEIVNLKLEKLCLQIINKGNELLSREEIDLAIDEFKKSFQIIKGYPPATERIAFAEKFRSDIKKSEELFNLGLQSERKNKFQEALHYYENASALRKSDLINQKIFELKNIIQLEADPKAFAMQVIKEFKKGMLVNKIAEIQKDLKIKWDKDLKDSGWKVIGSPTRFKVEVRYDFITPSENYFYSWQVNLKEKTITPLNKLSERIMRE